MGQRGCHRLKSFERADRRVARDDASDPAHLRIVGSILPTLPARSDRLVLAAAPLVLIATVLSATQGGFAGVVALAATLAATLGIARRVAGPDDLRFVVVVALGTLVLRVIAAGVLDAYLAGVNPNRALFYDDGAYVAYARQMADFWRGADIGFPSDPSVRNSYAIAFGMIFSLIGENVMVIRLVNTCALTIAGLLTYRTMVNLGMGGARWALLGICLFPSLALWSILALKDTYVLAWMVVAIWAASEFIRSGRYIWFVPTILALFVLDGARRYVFLVLALAWPLGTAIALVGRRRIAAASLAALCSASLAMSSRALETYTPETIGALSAVRAAMAKGARSALVDPLPAMRGSAGDRFLVTVSDDMPICTGQDRQIEVPLGSRVVVRLPGSALASQDPSVVYVAPCDVIVLIERPVAIGGTPRPRPPPGQGTRPSPTQSTPVPASTPQPPPQVVVLVPDARNVIAEVPAAPPDPTGFHLGLAESLIYFPTGLLFFLTAPFPLRARSASELAAIPEMLLWYVTVVLALYGLFRLLRGRNYRYAFGALALGGIAIVLSLAEGNAGTLIRHRAMTIVFVVVFAAVGLEALLTRLSRRRVG